MMYCFMDFFFFFFLNFSKNPKSSLLLTKTSTSAVRLYTSVTLCRCCDTFCAVAGARVFSSAACSIKRMIVSLVENRTKKLFILHQHKMHSCKHKRAGSLGITSQQRVLVIIFRASEFAHAKSSCLAWFSQAINAREQESRFQTQAGFNFFLFVQLPATELLSWTLFSANFVVVVVVVVVMMVIWVVFGNFS